MCQHCEGYDHTEDKAALGAALIRRQQDRQRTAAAPAPSEKQPGTSAVQPAAQPRQ